MSAFPKLPYDEALTPEGAKYIHSHPEQECVEIFDENMDRVGYYDENKKEMITGEELKKYPVISFANVQPE